jgi:hypothetical protein
MKTTDRIKELIELYSGFDADTLTEMYQIAQADFVEVKRRARQGLASAGEVRDAQHDFYAMRGIVSRLENGGAI